MRIRSLHPWNLTPSQAIDLQKKLSTQVECSDKLGTIRHVAGVDVGFQDKGRFYAEGSGGGII